MTPNYTVIHFLLNQYSFINIPKWSIINYQANVLIKKHTYAVLYSYLSLM